jgi:hypothetical protein
MNNKATLNEEYGTIVSEYVVELFGAYQGRYDVVCFDSAEPKMYVTVGSAKVVYITNSDIINLIKEAINNI